jgi:aminodeoxychorismate synthase component I
MKVEPLKDIPPTYAFMALRDMPRPFILSGGNGPGQRRFSIVSAGPFMVLTCSFNGTSLEGACKRTLPQDPFTALSDILSEYKDLERGPFPFNGGGVGYFSYDLKDIIENTRCGQTKRGDALDTPLCSIGFYDPVYVYDHRERRGFLVSAGTKGSDERLRRVGKALKGAFSGQTTIARQPKRGARSAGSTGANFTRQEYIDAINKAKSYIAAGDIYQINLSQKLTIPWEGDPFALYAALLQERPTRFSSYTDCGAFKIISNSPERLLRVEDGTVETQPIKGTRPRGGTDEEDRRFIEELKKSTKERAEHVMVVDLERNDLGRVSVPGTVEVKEFEKIETFPGLHHMVSTVRGRLKPGVDGPTGLRASFPGGSVTGAPKIRAMEIIDELEPVSRGIYTGGVGFIDFNGTMDISMAIRTAIYKDGLLHLHVGGGIVADSVPEDEYDETILKAGDFLEAEAWPFCLR